VSAMKTSLAKVANASTSANVEAQPRGGCAPAVFSDDKARWDGDASSEIAGPAPALRCGDWLAFFFIGLK
jgi:hypothetical protein